MLFRSSVRLASRTCVRPERLFSTTIPLRKQIHDADESTFKSHISNTKNKIILVDFYENWCAPCKVLSPLLERIERDPSIIGAKELDLVTIRGETVPGVVAQYEIRAVPTVFAFKDGAVVGQFVGALGLPQIKSWFNSLRK